MDKQSDIIIESAKRTFRIESEVLQKLNNSLNEDFVNCVHCILNGKGRVVLTGIGKSAIVAQKIAATFNSTGTPAIFMHAADAIHGDLGMIQQHDIIIAISKSGNTPEIKVLAPLLKSTDCILIAIVANMQSYLAKQASYILYTDIEQEACPHNLAPTASSIAQMAMGDALAVCVLEQRGFTQENFARFHPGGSLGKQLYLKVDDVYPLNNKPVVYPKTSLKDTLIEMTSKRLGAVVVVDEKNQTVLGIITDGDLRRCLQEYQSLNELKAENIMTQNPKCLYGGTLAIDALRKMEAYKITQMIIVENETQKYLGVVHIHDLLREGIGKHIR